MFSRIHSALLFYDSAIILPQDMLVLDEYLCITLDFFFFFIFFSIIFPPAVIIRESASFIILNCSDTLWSDAFFSFFFF